MSLESDLKKSYENIISVFYEIEQDTISGFNENEIIAMTLNLLKKVVEYEAIIFLKYNKEKELYTEKKSIHYNSKLKKYILNLIKDGIVEWAGRQGRPFITIEELGKIKTHVIVPVMQKDNMLGVIIMHTNEQEEYFDQNRLKVLKIISNQLSITFENISLYKDLEVRTEKLGFLKNYMNGIIESMTNGIIVMDTGNTIRVFNEKIQEMLRTNIKSVIYKKIENTSLNKNFVNKLLILNQKNYEGEKIIDEEVDYKFSEEEEIPLGISISLLKKNGMVQGTIFVIRDLSESKELKELRRIDKLKDEFLSMVSHELRTPLTSIKAYTETLIDMFEDESMEKEFLGIINEESDRLTRLINDVLDLSKIEAGKMNFIMEKHNLNLIVEKTSKNMTAFADTKSIKIILNLEEGMKDVLADKDRITQVLSNLINNAVKFTQEEGTITVSTSTYKKSYLKISIKDTGIGIKNNEIDMIFEKFKQSEDIMTRNAGGTGLGLPICKNIIEYHGGRIWVESEYCKGSEFIFTLPTYENYQEK